MYQMNLSCPSVAQLLFARFPENNLPNPLRDWLWTRIQAAGKNFPTWSVGSKRKST
jgi:hypothetical protein